MTGWNSFGGNGVEFLLNGEDAGEDAMNQSDAEWIEKRAYALWEEDGRPNGRDADHWRKAHQEYLAMTEGASKAKAGTRRRVAAAAEAEQADLPQPSPGTSPQPLMAKTKRPRKE